MNKSEVTTLDDQAPVASVEVEIAAKPRKVAKEVKGANADGALSGKRVTLTIHGTAEQDGQEDVFIGLNGFGYKIKRGEPCFVPEEVAGIIKEAIVTSMRPGQAGSVTESKAPRFAYTITE